MDRELASFFFFGLSDSKFRYWNLWIMLKSYSTAIKNVIATASMLPNKKNSTAHLNFLSTVFNICAFNLYFSRWHLPLTWTTRQIYGLLTNLTSVNKTKKYHDSLILRKSFYPVLLRSPCCILMRATRNSIWLPLKSHVFVLKKLCCHVIVFCLNVHQLKL